MNPSEVLRRAKEIQNRTSLTRRDALYIAHSEFARKESEKVLHAATRYLLDTDGWDRAIALAEAKEKL